MKSFPLLGLTTDIRDLGTCLQTQSWYQILISQMRGWLKQGHYNNSRRHLLIKLLNLKA